VTSTWVPLLEPLLCEEAELPVVEDCVEDCCLLAACCLSAACCLLAACCLEVDVCVGMTDAAAVDEEVGELDILA
jgi:hypothetical protein